MFFAERRLKTKKLVDKLAKDKALDFIAAGVGCNCLVSLHKAGILDKLIKKGFIRRSEVSAATNPTCLHAALTTLTHCGIVVSDPHTYALTPTGLALGKYKGVLNIFFEGYADLISKQGQIANSTQFSNSLSLKGKPIAEASAAIASDFIMPILIEELVSLEVNGTICDFGCGLADMLATICKVTGKPGLGFEVQQDTVRAAKSKFSNDRQIEIEKGDVTQLDGVWEDVSLLMQCHVFHDFVNGGKFDEILRSYRKSFPNHRQFLYIDSISAEEDHGTIFPGFDYVHGLLGIDVPTYQETLNQFQKAGYVLSRETQVKDLPNTFIWVLDRQDLAGA